MPDRTNFAAVEINLSKKEIPVDSSSVSFTKVEAVFYPLYNQVRYKYGKLTALISASF